MKRRTFVQSSVQAAAWTALSHGRVLGANDRIHIGLIGCGGRGSLDARLIRGTMDDIQAVAPANYHDGNVDPQLKEPRNVEISGLCDVWRDRIDKALRWAPGAKTCKDFRRLLEDKEIDAVVIGTHDPWHAPMAILAAEAGKDMYLEKPVMFTIREGKAITEAVRKNKVICQIGSQHRSGDHFAEAARIVQSGRIGPVYFVRVWNNLNMNNRRPSPDGPVPAGLDWNFWLGPAPYSPFNPDRLEYRSFMDYTNGLISDYGMHRFDSVHQIMGVETPLSVSASWGRFKKEEKVGDLPDIHQATFEYPGFIMSYECLTVNSHGLGGRTPGQKYYGAKGPEDRPHGMAFYGTKAALFVDRIGMELYSEPKPGGGAWEPLMEKMLINEDEPTPLHCKYFIDSLRSRKDPFANIEVGCRATITPLIGNIAAKTGKKLKWDPVKLEFPGEPEANRMLFREYRKPWDLVKIV